MPGVCPRCLREVYFAEEKLALGKVWHNFCFSCRNCRKLLDSWTVATHSGELFCRNCYNRLFSITSVRTALPAPRISHILQPADKADPRSLSPCDSLSDCCCCCCCNDECLLIDPQNQDFEIRGSSVSIQERQRLRGGRDEEPLETNQVPETGAGKLGSESESSKLDARSSVDFIGNQPSGPTAVTGWYNRQQSASQSVVSNPPSSDQQLLVRPSSTPATVQAAIVNANGCSAHRRPGNPCRANYGHSQYSKHCHRYRCYDSQNSDKAQGSQEHGKIIRVCQGRNFAENYRNCLSRPGRSLSTFALQSKPEASFLKPLAKSPITIDSPRPKSSYPPLPPHHSPPPSRRRVSFRAAKVAFPKDTSDCRPAMQNIVDGEERSHVDIISFEQPSYQEEVNPNKNDELPASGAIGSGGGNDIDPCDCHSEYESCDDERMRGGCGGGSGCCCGSGGSRASPTLRHSGQSPCSQRYQGDRGSTVEGACGCSDRGRSRCRSGTSGGCCSAGSEVAPGRSARSGGCRSSGYEGSNEGACASKDPCARRPTGHESCPPRSVDPCSTDPSTLSSCSASACSPPCSGRKGCCPPAGCRPVRRRIDRCNTPCTGDTPSCGGGGCCGSGCRGGCGKPGQICLPLRPCTIPPCKPHPRGGGSPCMPPRRCAPQPPCCRSPVLPGRPGSTSANGAGSGCCRSASPVGRSAGGGGCPQISNCQQQQDDGFVGGSCCSPKLPTGCECLGGGQDCQRCGRKVYQAEMQIASGVPYHNICFSCFCCRKPLETLTYHENCGEIYCKQCYVRNFGPQGYGYSGVLQTPM